MQRLTLTAIIATKKGTTDRWVHGGRNFELLLQIMHKMIDIVCSRVK